jgi:8-amino-7-oxononanoate synthase
MGSRFRGPFLFLQKQILKKPEDFIQFKINERKQSNSFRSLKQNGGLIDFCSNDYLGFARSTQLKLTIEEELKRYPLYTLGSTGSRLISGNSSFVEELEQEIADFHEAESGLIFNSGYDANLGLLSSLPQRGDTVIVDELAHASIIDGIRLSHAGRFSFRHNNLSHLEEKLKAAKGQIYVVVESIYSMDGDEAPLFEIATLAGKYNAALIVDEAHATGIFGDGGRGIVSRDKLQEKVFARVVTFGKALGVHGAIILGSPALREYLINFSRSFIYTTTASFHSHLSIKAAYGLLKITDRQSILKEKITLFRNSLNSCADVIESRSPIQCLLIPGNFRSREASHKLQKEGFDVRAILHPTVAEGKERLRICLHAFNSDEEIINLTRSLNRL